MNDPKNYKDFIAAKKEKKSLANWKTTFSIIQASKFEVGRLKKLLSSSFQTKTSGFIQPWWLGGRVCAKFKQALSLLRWVRIQLGDDCVDALNKKECLCREGLKGIIVAPTCHRQEYSSSCLQMVKWKFVIVMCMMVEMSFDETHNRLSKTLAFCIVLLYSKC